MAIEATPARSATELPASHSDQVLRVAALLFAVGAAAHASDHLRRGLDLTPVAVAIGGFALTPVVVAVVWAVFADHPAAPEAAAVVGAFTAVAVSATHLLPYWGPLSEPFRGGIDAYSWASVSANIVTALALAVVATRIAMRRRAALAHD